MRRTHCITRAVAAFCLLITAFTARADTFQPIVLRIGGHAAHLPTPALSNGRETYVPFETLPLAGAKAKWNGKHDAIFIVTASGKHGEIGASKPDGRPLFALSELARLLDAVVAADTDTDKSPNPKPKTQNPKSVCLLARVTDAHLENGTLHVTTSFPVPYRTKMLTYAVPHRAYVDCLGATLKNSLPAAPPVSADEKRTLHLRFGQNNVETARIVIELGDGATLHEAEFPANRAVHIAAAVSDTGKAVTAKTTPPKQSTVIAKTLPKKNIIAAKIPTKKNSIVVAKNAPTGKNDKKNSAPEKPKRTEIATVIQPPAILDRPTPYAPDYVPAPPDTDKNPQTRNRVVLPSVSDDTDLNSVKTDVPAKLMPPTHKTVHLKPKPNIPPYRSAVRRDATPIVVSGVELIRDNDRHARLQISTTGKAFPYVHYQQGAAQLIIDIPNASLKLDDPAQSEQTLKHPLLSGVRAAQVQDTPPVTRITLDMTRVVGYNVDAQDKTLSLELRVPRNATGALADKLIIVDPGHGGSSTGALGHGDTTIYEKDVTLAIALKLRTALEGCGARVVMTRDKDVDVALYDRPHMANDIGADLFVSIHNDSNGRVNSASGTSTYYHMGDPSSRALAVCIQQAVSSVTGLPSRGALSDGILYANGLAVLRASIMPAALCEVAYINNAHDRRKLTDPEFQQRVAIAICRGIRSYVEGSPQIERVPPPMETEPTTEPTLETPQKSNTDNNGE